MYKNNKTSKLLRFLLILIIVMTAITGCGSSKDKDNTAGETDSSDKQGSLQNDEKSAGGSGGSEENTAMGRYVESAIDLSEYCRRPLIITLRDDGSLAVADYYGSWIVSKDNGSTWEYESQEWFRQFKGEETYILDMAYGADGTAGIIYTREFADEETEEETEGEKDESDPETEEVSYKGFDSVGLVIKPDGTQIPIQVALKGEDTYLWGIWISEKGQVFVTTSGCDIYKINDDGTGERYLTLESRAELIQFQGNLMIMDRYGEDKTDGLLIYDMEKEEFIEDEVLNDFLYDNYKTRDAYNGSEYFDLFFFPGEEGVLYLAGEKGLHRHVIGGSAVEQIIDGSLSCFNNPSYYLNGMVMLPDNKFLALFDGGKAVLFTYNPDVPAVPSERLKVYSLKDNDTMRQAVTIYQTNTPEIYVEYEIGMGEDGSVTREDALKKLNTQIMAGEGPDVLVLDDMPIDSYVEKGLLLDLGDFLGSLSGSDEIYGNIIDAFKKDGKVYMIPCEIQLPFAAGEEKYMSQMKDLEGIANAIVDLREDNPGKALLEVCTEKGIMALFSMVCAPEWKTAEGELNDKAIEEFLYQSKRIYDAVMDGISDQFLERYRRLDENLIQYYGVGRDDPDLARHGSYMNYLAKQIQINCGEIDSIMDYTGFLSIPKVAGYENNVLAPLGGQSKDVFLPETLIGINAATSRTERAQELMKVLLGKESQTALFKGFAVNKAVFEEMLEKDASELSEDGIYSSLAMSDEDGLAIQLNLYWPTEEQKQFLCDWVMNVKTPYITDQVLEDAVYKEGAEYMKGNKDLEETVEAIKQSVSIYMSE